MLRQQILGVEHEHSGGREDDGQAEAEREEQHHAEADPAYGDCAQEQNERGGAGHESATRSESDEAAHGDVAFGHMRMRVAVVGVSERAVRVRVRMVVIVALPVIVAVPVIVRMVVLVSVIVRMNRRIVRMAMNGGVGVRMLMGVSMIVRMRVRVRMIVSV